MFYAIVFLLGAIFWAWFYWPMSSEGFTHYGKLYRVPIYISGMETGIPCVRGCTRGYDLLLYIGWPEFAQFVGYWMCGHVGFPFQVLGEIKREGK